MLTTARFVNVKTPFQKTLGWANTLRCGRAAKDQIDTQGATIYMTGSGYALTSGSPKRLT